MADATTPLPFLTQFITPLSIQLNLPTLPLHIHTVLLSFLAYSGIHLLLSPLLSTRLFPGTYPNLASRTRLNWNVHVVSLAQCLFINVLALYAIRSEADLRSQLDWRGRIFGYTALHGLVQGCAAGYFLWDVVVSASDIRTLGIGSLAHAICALIVTLIGFRPFANYYGTSFILYELSSPFLNVHWFCDKLGLTGSRLQWYNGVVLLGTFFGCRLVWGSWLTVKIYADLYQAVIVGGMGTGMLVEKGAKAVVAPKDLMRYAGNQTLPVWLWATYLVVNTVLSFLNFYWFALMVGTVRKRFQPEGSGAGRGTGNGEVRDGRKVLVDGTDLVGKRNGKAE